MQMLSLDQLGSVNRGKSKHRPRNDKRLFENGIYPFFQTGDVKSAPNLLVDCKKKYGEFGLAQSKLWPAGTLCITIAANINDHNPLIEKPGVKNDVIARITAVNNILPTQLKMPFPSICSLVECSL